LQLGETRGFGNPMVLANHGTIEGTIDQTTNHRPSIIDSHRANCKSRTPRCLVSSLLSARHHHEKLTMMVPE